jgi:phospholipid-binding lipoprotein MlaA
MSSLRRPSLLLLGLLALSACATRPPDSEPEALAEYEQNNDPLEPFNRAMYTVQNGIDQAVLRPAAKAYQFVVPQPVRTGVRNVLANLRTPVIAVNDLARPSPPGASARGPSCSCRSWARAIRVTWWAMAARWPPTR